MTKILIDRAVVEQALEALEAGPDVDPIFAGEAEAAFRAALAEPCPCGDRPAAQCPGKWEPGCDLGNNPKYARRVNLAEPEPPIGKASTDVGVPVFVVKKAEPVQEPDPSRCPQCGGPADNGHDREVPPTPYFCTKCMAEPVAWTPVAEALPNSGVKVLACYRNRLGNLRRIRAMWTAAKTEEADSDDAEACSEYDEATDTYYVTEGWYECVENWGDYSSVAVTEGEVTHWMPLPPVPSTSPPQRPAEPVQEPDVPATNFGNMEPVGWLESPHGAFRANPLYKIQFPSQLLSWQIPVFAAHGIKEGT